MCVVGGVRVKSLSVVGRGGRSYGVRSVLVLLYTMKRGILCVCRVGGSRVVVYVLLAGDQDKTVREKRQECEYWYSQSGTVPWDVLCWRKKSPNLFLTIAERNHFHHQVIDSSVPAEPLNLQIFDGKKTWNFVSYLLGKTCIVRVLLKPKCC